ncbi:MAG: hypothetical protein AABN95_04440 [Acidobacteriota bacterium]
MGLRTTEFGPQIGPAFKATTDPDGNYRVTDVPAGNYQVVPMAPAYVVSDSSSFGNPGKALILPEGERVEGIDFSIIRGSVITGKVTQSDGKPVIEERVYVVPAEQPNQRGTNYGGSSFQTDDRGVYRMFGLRPGRYKVSIGLPDDALAPNRLRQTYPRVFYPGVTDFDEAKIVELGEGAEVSNIDITVGQTMQGFAASGVVVDGETNQPIADVRFGLQRILEANNAPFMGTSATSNSRGEFRVENITPGKYAIFVMPQQNSDIRVDPLRFEIVNQDVTGLMLRTSKGAVVSGVVVLEGTQDKGVYSRLAKLRLFAYVRGGDGVDSIGFGQTSTIEPDGSFRLGGLQAGSASFQLSSPGARSQTGFVISRIERDGVVQPRSGVEIKSAEQIAGLRIIVVYGSGTVRGSVKWDTGSTPTGARLMVRLTKPGDNSYAIRPQAVDARGHFVFQGVPAGSYEVNLNVFIPQSRARQPSARQAVTVTDGVVTEVELVVDPNVNVPPTP